MRIQEYCALEDSFLNFYWQKRKRELIDFLHLLLYHPNNYSTIYLGSGSSMHYAHKEVRQLLAL